MRVVERLKYVKYYRDRHGHERWYFRRAGQPQIALPSPKSPGFREAYNAALAAHKLRPSGSDRSALGSLSAAIGSFYADPSFLALAESSRAMRRQILERLRRVHGAKPLAELERRHITALLAKQKPFAAHNWLKAMRGLMKFAVAVGLRADDPTADIERAKVQGGHIHTWDEAEIARFEATHPMGSKARLAMALMLYTGQRRSDIVRLGPQHVRDGILYVRQQKTGMAKRDEVLEIPVHPELAHIIAATPTGALAFLVTKYGKPYTVGAFGWNMRQWCDAAGLAQCSSHGLRKAICRRLAEAGCSAPQIASISGHKTLSEVQRYIAAADQRKLARAAIEQIGTNASGTKVSNLLPKLANLDSKQLK